MKTIITMLLLTAIGYYVYSINAQVESVKSLCAQYKEGSTAEGIAENAKKHSIEFRGPYEIKELPGVKRVILCAHLSMCDTSCEIQYKDNKVIKNNFIQF